MYGYCFRLYVNVGISIGDGIDVDDGIGVGISVGGRGAAAGGLAVSRFLCTTMNMASPQQ